MGPSRSELLVERLKAEFSLLLWILVVDELLQKLTQLGFECVDNADDIIMDY